MKIIKGTEQLILLGNGDFQKDMYEPLFLTKARNNSLSLNNKHTNYSAEFKIKVAKAYAEGKHSFEEIAQLYGIYMDPLKLARDFDNFFIT